MIKKNNIYLREIERFINFLNDLSREDLNRLELGESRISNILTNNKTFTTKGKSVVFDIDNIIKYLSNSESREASESYLNSQNFKRVDFEAICRELDIPFTKKDKIEKIIDKIIEGTIGFKLRSQAIQDK